jgi:hypothetical protein
MVVSQIRAEVPPVARRNGTHNVVPSDFETSTGRMNWYGAMAWVEWLASVGYGGADDWRLPFVVDSGAPVCDFAFIGTDCGYNVDTATGELAHLRYDTLGNIAEYDISGNDLQPGAGLTSTGPFYNMQASWYWSGPDEASFADYGWYLLASGGLRSYYGKSFRFNG